MTDLVKHHSFFMRSVLSRTSRVVMITTGRTTTVPGMVSARSNMRLELIMFNISSANASELNPWQLFSQF
jgi:hypothetical protein